MAFDELKFENINEYNQRYLIEESQNIEYLNKLKEAVIGYVYNCSGFQDKADKVIIRVNEILEEYSKESGYYYLSHPNEPNMQDCFYADSRVREFLKNNKLV